MPTDTTLLRIDDPAFGTYPAYFQERVKQLAQALEAGKITVDEWLVAMRAELEDLHHTAYFVGSGQPDDLSDEALAVIAAIVAAQFGFLVKWAAQLEGMKDIKASTLESRAKLYLLAANATVQQAQVQRMGMPQLPAYPGDGSSQCLNACLCSWRIEQLAGEGNYDCYWTLGEPETNHCENCPNRAGAWNPLQIRGGEIQHYSESGLFADR